MSVQTVENKRYEKVNIVEDPSVFRGYLGNCEVSSAVLQKLSKELGFSYELYVTLNNIDEVAANTLVKSMSKKTNNPEVVFLVESEENVVLDYSLESDRTPILNSEFVKRVSSLSETTDTIELSEVYYHKDDKISSVILKKNSPITIEEKFGDCKSNIIEYSIGVLIVNDETTSAYSRLVLYVDGQPLYLPASYYNTTTSRFKRSTSSSVEALEVLILKVIDDLREESFYSKLYDLHFKYRSNKEILTSYEEYNTVLRTMRKIPTIIEDNSFLESLLSRYEDFEKKYSHLDDQKSSYIWRCTAVSNITVDSLVSITSKILSDLSAPPIEYFAIRELLGTYISTNRIVEEIAKEDIR